MAIVNKFNVNKEQVTLDADIIENMSANDVSYNDSSQYDKNTVGDKLSELEKIKNVIEYNSANIYDPSKDIVGNLTTSGTIDTSNHDFKVSDFIPVTAGVPVTMSVWSEYYSYNGVYSYGIWSEDKNTFFGRIDVSEEDSSAGYKTYLPTGNYWIRLKVGVNSTNIMVNYGNELLPYEPYIEMSAIDKVSRNAIDEIRLLIVNRDVKITKVNNDQILVSQLQEDGSYIDWQWVRKYYARDGIVCNNHWTTEAIMHKGNTIGQSNINFVYEVSANSFTNEDLYAGNGHGCCVMDFCKFFADGKEIDITTLTEPLYCGQFRILERSQCYAIDKTASSSSELGFPKLNNGVPIVAFIHYYDVVYTRESCEYNNYLTSKRDNTFFRKCYGAMLSCHLPYFTKVVIGNGNTYQYNPATDEKTPLFNSPTLASLIKIGTFIPNANSVVQYGDNYIFSTEMVHSDDIPNSHTNIEADFGRNGLVAGDKKEQKMYLQPIHTYNPSNTSWHDVLNNGDTIRVKVVKRIKYMP